MNADDRKGRVVLIPLQTRDRYGTRGGDEQVRGEEECEDRLMWRWSVGGLCVLLDAKSKSESECKQQARRSVESRATQSRQLGSAASSKRGKNQVEKSAVRRHGSGSSVD
ncbi:hypothetical protein ES702_00187 [subsurface metagenome]